MEKISPNNKKKGVTHAINESRGNGNKQSGLWNNAQVTEENRVGKRGAKEKDTSNKQDFGIHLNYYFRNAAFISAMTLSLFNVPFQNELASDAQSENCRRK